LQPAINRPKAIKVVAVKIGLIVNLPLGKNTAGR
jgi:hypothetical protein